MLETSIHCEAYGAVLRTNVHWTTLRAAPARENPITIAVQKVERLPEAQPALNTCELQRRTLRVIGTAPDIQMRVDDCLLVTFEQAQRRLDCFVTAEAADSMVEYWLLRQIVPIARLIWGDAEILHAGAVRIDGEAAAFLAPSGTGKSTLVGHFVERGHNLITDDHLVMQRHNGRHGEPTWVLPTIPYYRNFRAIETLGRYTTRYDTAACRLRVIYVLKPAGVDAPVAISALPNAEAALEMLYQAPYNLLNRMMPKTYPLFQRRFEFISNLPLNVHVRRLEVPRSLHRLPEVEAHIIADFRRLSGSSHASV